MELANKVIYSDWNTKGKDLVVGDLHGCYNEFMYFLTALNFNFNSDICNSVGDLIDRGENSYECLQLIYEPWFKSIYANHEQMMVEGLLGKNDNMMDYWIYNDGSWQYGYDNQKLKDDAQFIVDNIPYVRVIGRGTNKRVNIVHAEFFVNPNTYEYITDKDIDNWVFTGNTDGLIWGRRFIENKISYRNDSKYDNSNLSITYCGHTPVEIPIQVMNHRYIDTGAVFAVTKQLDRVMTIVDMQLEIIYTMNMKSKEIKSFYWN